MNNLKLIRSIQESYLVRCICWNTCAVPNCYHHEPHTAGISCKYNSPVKFCKAVQGFVHDLPISQLQENYECDPNLAFRAQKEAEGKYHKDHEGGGTYF